MKRTLRPSVAIVLTILDCLLGLSAINSNMGWTTVACISCLLITYVLRRYLND